MDPFLGQILMFGGTFAPRGWAFCDGQLLPINQFSALFSLLGTTYGGDGRTSFALPDLRGRAPIHEGHGPGLTDRKLGAKIGAETNTITVNQMPSHNHLLEVHSEDPDTDDPDGAILSVHNEDSFSTGNPTGTMKSTAISHTGGGQPVNNMPPCIAINYIIALQGVFPSRS